LSIWSHDTLMILVSANGVKEWTTATMIRRGQYHCHWTHFFLKQKNISQAV